jgi:hypothetical protein
MTDTPAEMPERIWVQQSATGPFKVLEPHDRDFYRRTEYVLASTHARAMEALERYQKLDREAATHVESVICMRTGFTGEPPYVGWKGLGLALTEALDQRDRAMEALAEAENIWTDFGQHIGLSLEFCYPENDDSGVWMVHERRGNHNDREWVLMGQGGTPLAAVKAALSLIATAKGEQP